MLTDTITFNVLYDRFLNTLLAAFNASRTGTIVRDMQYEVLINGWFESPIIGNGLTACARVFIDVHMRLFCMQCFIKMVLLD